MSPGIFSARIIAPIHFTAAGGRPRTIPLGPCLIEARGSHGFIDIVWGAAGEQSAALAPEEVESAELCGKLVVLDDG